MNKKTFLLLALLATTACTVGPDFKRPDATAAADYAMQGDAVSGEQKIALGKELAAEWWSLLGSKPLDALVQEALKGNNNIAAARERLAAANEAVTAQAGTLLPQVGLNGTAGRQKYGVALFGPSNFTIPPFSYYEAGPSASLALDIFGGDAREIERKKALAEYQFHELNAAYVNLTGSTVAAAVEIASARAELAATESILDTDRELVRLTQASYKGGSGTKVDVLSAQSQLDADQALLPPLRQRVSVARHALAVLLGRAPSEWAAPDFALDSFTLPKEIPAALPSELARKRPDILAAEANLHAASAAVGVATANLYPKFSLTASSLQEALTPHGLFSAPNNAWALAGNITAPLFNGGTLKAEKREAEHRYQEALAQYKQTVIVALGQVADALTALAHDADIIKDQQQTVRTAQASLDLARKSYKAGETDILRVQDAQRVLARARIGLVSAQGQRYQNTAKLFVALGGSPVN